MVTSLSPFGNGDNESQILPHKLVVRQIVAKPAG
jgi:hypothetical protein